MSLLYSFVRANKRLCAACERRFPGFFDRSFAADTYLPELRDRLEGPVRDGRRLLEVGGIDRPLLERKPGFHYAGLDVEETAACDVLYDEFRCQSVEDPIDGEFDVIFSVTLLEHVPNNHASARSMANALAPGGLCIHYVPGKGHPYALALRAVGPEWQKRLLRVLNEGGTPSGGYHSHFDQCSVNGMTRLFRNAGLTDVEAKTYYSPTPYFRIFFPAHVLVAGLMWAARRFGWTYFASGFIVSGRKP